MGIPGCDGTQFLDPSAAAEFPERITEVTGVGITMSQVDDATLVRLEGMIDIPMAAELKETLGRAIAECRPIRIAIEGVTGLDVKAFQVLRAARRDAERKAIELRFAGKLADPIQSFLESVGLVELTAPE